MDIYTYLLEGVATSTTPPDETAAQTQTRREAIAAMFHGYDPTDTKEATIACHCIELQFLLRAAVRDAGNLRLDHDDLVKARTGAMALSKTWNLWVTKLEKIQQRKRVEAAEALKAAQANATTGVSPVTDPLAAKPASKPPLNAPPVSTRSETFPDRAMSDGAPPIAGLALPPAARSPLAPPSNVSAASAAGPHVARRETVPVGSDSQSAAGEMISA